MTTKKDLNQIAKIEKAIKEKYGEEAIQNPKRHWDEEKEKKYLSDLKKFHERPKKEKKTEESEGFTVKSKRTSKNEERICPVCKSYSFSNLDDVYMVKFECCFNCYVQFVEDREERWKTGWRPNN